MVSIEAQADALAHARKSGTVLPDLPGPVPATVEEAYRLQRAVQEAMGEPTCGWKIGATNRAIQEAIGTSEPFFGPLYAPRCHTLGATLPVADGLLGIECEFAFRLAHPLPPRSAAYAPDEVAAAVASLHPAIELVGLRLPPTAFRDARWCIADHALSVAFVAGDAITDWRALDLPALAVHSIINGTEVATGRGAAVLGNPLVALTWLANALSRRGLGLRADDWVSTGTSTGIQTVQPGDAVEAVFDRIGRVRANFA